MIHHSGRGSQYTYTDYIDLLQENNCEISMPIFAQDNAYAERINRIIKEEYLNYWKPNTFDKLRKSVAKAVKHYNNKRPHNNLGRLTLVESQRNWEENKIVPKPIITIFDNEILMKNSQP